MAKKIRLKIINENKDDKIHIKSFEDIPKAYDDDQRETIFTDEFINTPSKEQLEEEEVKLMWRDFIEGLTRRQKSILKSLLGLDKERFTIDQISRIQAAMKGK